MIRFLLMILLLLIGTSIVDSGLNGSRAPIQWDAVVCGLTIIGVVFLLLAFV